MPLDRDKCTRMLDRCFCLRDRAAMPMMAARHACVSFLVLVAVIMAHQTTAKPSPSDYATEAQSIINSLLPGGSCADQAWHKLAALTDTVGNRVCGSPSLERASSYMLSVWQAEGFDNVHGENVTVPHWQRGDEECTMLSPRLGYRMQILGLGTSIGTPEGRPIEAHVLVVRNFDELAAFGKAGQVQGKIVLVNYACDWSSNPVGCYGACAKYRGEGASRAARWGAVAYLVRSLASASIGSPHTGMQTYASSKAEDQIPAAAVTVEDAEALARMQARGQDVVLRLSMGAQNLPARQARNVVAEWRGTELPDEVVLLSGHLDSWDVGVGAMDDGGGLVISWQALSTLRALHWRARRTIRVVGWVGEEFGGIGGRQYFDDHREEKVVLVIESDMGAFRPRGLSFSGGEEAASMMADVGSLLGGINATLVARDGKGYETDTQPWKAVGVPGASLISENERYFAYHHSHGDQMNVLQPGDMDLAAAVFAVTAFVVADLDEALPKGDERGEGGKGKMKEEKERRRMRKGNAGSGLAVS